MTKMRIKLLNNMQIILECVGVELITDKKTFGNIEYTEKSAKIIGGKYDGKVIKFCIDAEVAKRSSKKDVKIEDLLKEIKKTSEETKDNIIYTY